MAARDTKIESTGAWVAVTDGAVETVEVLQVVSKNPALLRAAASAPAADDPGILWPSGAVELALTVPGGSSTMWMKPAGNHTRAEVYVKHA